MSGVRSANRQRVQAPARRTIDIDSSDDDEQGNQMSVERVRETIMGKTALSSRVDNHDEAVLANGDGIDDDLVVQAKKKTKRAPAPKFDETLLKNDIDGLPQLLRNAQKYKYRGPGNEAHDLNQLMRNYQNWLHDLYPREGYYTKVRRLDKLRKEEIRHYIRNMRTDAVKKHNREEEEDEDVDLVSDDDNGDVNMTSNITKDRLHQPLVLGTTSADGGEAHGGGTKRPESPALIPGVDSVKERIKRNRERAMARLRERQAQRAIDLSRAAPTQPVAASIVSKEPVGNKSNEPSEDEVMESQMHSGGGGEEDMIDFDEEAMADAMHAEVLYQQPPQQPSKQPQQQGATQTQPLEQTQPLAQTQPLDLMQTAAAPTSTFAPSVSVEGANDNVSGDSVPTVQSDAEGSCKIGSTADVSKSSSVSVVDTVPSLEVVATVAAAVPVETVPAVQIVPVVQQHIPEAAVPVPTAAIESVPAVKTVAAAESVPVFETTPVVETIPAVVVVPVAALKTVPAVASIPAVASVETIPAAVQVVSVAVEAVPVVAAAATVPSGTDNASEAMELVSEASN